MNPNEKLREMLDLSDVKYAEAIGDSHLLLTFYAGGDRMLLKVEVFE